ncbi:MAG: hypothetical protein F9K32_13050 [Desulfobulbaceae bacterium]|nr:MAG: hypothetical protein F9K32_13050 [Desulfobulbaceae bacterium]
MALYLKQFSRHFVTTAAAVAVIAVVAIELLAGPWVKSFESHEVDATLHVLEKKELNKDVVVLGDSVGRGIFSGWRSGKGTVAMLACNQATETTGQYFFLKRYLEHNGMPGAVIICDRTPGKGDLNQALTENYVQRCFTRWREILGLFRVKLDPVFTAKMVAYKLLATFKNRLHLQRTLVGFTNSDIYSGVVPASGTTPGGYGIFDVIEDEMRAARTESVSWRYLRQMLEELDGLNIPVYYLPPVTTQKIDDSHQLVQHSLAMFRDFERQFGGLHVLTDAYVRLPKSHFSDEVHLNELGLAAYRPLVQSRLDEIVQEAVDRRELNRDTAFARGTPLFSYADGKTLRMLRPVGTAAAVQGEALQLSAATKDPALLLPGLAGVEKPGQARVVVRVRMEGDSSTVARLYYAAGDEDFAQQRSLRAKVGPGLNQVSFLLPADFQGGKLRFDPGEAEGRYVLHAVEGRIIAADDAVYF